MQFFFVVQLHMSDLPLPCLITGGYALVGKGSYMDLSFISNRGMPRIPELRSLRRNDAKLS
jgi:hypothetical protein